jgi:hypothetical protein
MQTETSVVVNNQAQRQQVPLAYHQNFGFIRRNDWLGGDRMQPTFNLSMNWAETI